MNRPHSHRRYATCTGYLSCRMCNGEICNLCGAGCWNNKAIHCDHDVAERHEEPEPPEMDEPRDQY